jgi:hypothetical protein
MAAASKDGRECAARDANQSAPRRAFDRRDGLNLRVRPNHYQDAVNTAARLAQTVGGASVVRAEDRWGVGRCQVRCREVDRDYRWASVAGE